MNTDLMEQVVKHIFSNFVLIPSAFINFDNSKSLINKDFLLSDKLSFELDEGKIIKNNIYGCKVSISQQDITILLGDCSQNVVEKEYCLIIQVKNSPTYGLYLINTLHHYPDNEAMLACSMDKKGWMECQTYLQGTFLAGMEHIRDIKMPWIKCSSYKEEYQSMLSFIKFHNTIFEAKYER